MSDVSRRTTLLDVLMADESFFDRLVAAFPDAARFAKVLIREDTAGQLTLTDVANMVGAPVSGVVAVACNEDSAAEHTHPAGGLLVVGIPDWPGLDSEQTCHFDTRPLFDAGHEPLPMLLSFADGAPDDCVLVIESPFHPQPLRRLFEGRGYESAADSVGDNHWRTYFRKIPAG